MWRAAYPKLLAVYELKEEFYEIFDGDDRNKAVERLEAWREKMTGRPKEQFKPPQHEFQVVGHGLDMTGFMLKQDLGVPFSTFNGSETPDHDSTSDYG